LTGFFVQSIKINLIPRDVFYRVELGLPVNAIEKVYQALSKLFTISATEKVYHLET